ncbi:hypothetical protein VTN77DRAFT_8698 [Rasamsonia byssochlamydoides]|uniref:uncharacterized protein n=1 Tax=Rasamsonia byssochlamydoides TaxID=89139 RepID=UPI0037421F63
MYDGVSVVGFRCHIGDRILDGVVKEKEQAKADFDEAVRLGQGAGLLKQSVDASDVFRTKLGNIPANGTVTVEIVYIGELKQDAQTNGVRYVLPTVVAPRYGTQRDSSFWSNIWAPRPEKGGIKITLDVSVEKGAVIRGLQSPSHPYQMSLGRTSTMPEGSFEPHLASATASIPARDHVLLEQDFVMLVNAEGQDTPVAFLETHSTLPNQRALMASLVPKFTLPNNTPEIVFIIDRSGSMGDKIETLKSALRVFLKSLPVGVMFNICSFGSHYSFLWQRSKSYNASSLEEALRHVETIGANMGGTEMYQPVEATVANRLKDMELDVLLLTDGEIWGQKKLFSFIERAASENPIRFFSLGIGHGASHALIEGIARAGNGFAQSVLQMRSWTRRSSACSKALSHPISTTTRSRLSTARRSRMTLRSSNKQTQSPRLNYHSARKRLSKRNQRRRKSSRYLFSTVPTRNQNSRRQLPVLLQVTVSRICPRSSPQNCFRYRPRSRHSIPSSGPPCTFSFHPKPTKGFLRRWRSALLQSMGHCS